MATKAQQAALSASKSNYNTAKKNTDYTKKVYGTAFSNYRNAVNQGYKPSSKVISYQNASDKALAAAKAMGDFKYNSNYTDKITGLLDQAENMDFSMNYSLTDDPAYQAYRDQYVHNGQLAAQDAAGNAAAQTGGYGSTAAIAASQQAYNESLTQLNNIVPELYGQAYEREWNKFTNERDTLQQLAAAYQSLDQQEYDQALSTWTNNFNQYISIANEYQSKYEYLDSAERAQYETKLDGLYNMLTTAQNQYNTNQNLQLEALNSYGSMANDIANYEETVRANKASEAAAAAQLAEERRQFNASLAASKSSGSGSGNSGSNNTVSGTFKGDEITNGFTANYPLSKVNSNAALKKSLKENITTIYNNGKMTEEEYAFLLDHYNM